MPCRYLFFFAVIYLFPNAARSQEVQTLWLHPLTAQEGLTQSYNWYIYHDSEGFVWISSLSGLNRFDGVNIRQYNAIGGDSTSLLGENIYSRFFEDKRQNLWFSTPEAIHCYVRQRDHFRRYFLPDSSGGQISGDYKVFFLEKDTFLWVSNRDAVYRFNIHLPYQPAKKVVATNQFQYKVETDEDGAVRTVFAFRMTNGLEVYPIKNGELARNDDFSVFFPHSFVRAVLPESDTRVWLVTDEEGLISLNPREKKQWHIWGHFDSRLISMVPVGNEHLLLVTKSRLMLLFNKETGSILPISCKFIEGDDSAAQSFMDAYLDDEENLWISDDNQGLHYANLRKAKFLSLPKLPSAVGSNYNYSYWSLKEDRKGNIWVGTSPAGVFLLDRQGQLIRQLIHRPGSRNTLPSNMIRDILPDSDDNILIATTNGLAWLNPPYNNIQLIPKENGEKNYQVFHLHRTRSGKILASVEYGGIFELREKKGKKQLVNVLPAAADEYQTIFEDNNNRLYCVRNAEKICVFRFEDNRLVLQDSFPVSGFVNGFYEDEGSGILYFATSNGLVKVNRDQARAEPAVYTEANGLPGKFIGALSGLPEQKLWLGTNKGLAFFDGLHDSIHVFSFSDGVQSPEFHITAALKRSNGELWFGGSNGITIIPAAGVSAKVSNLPKILITGIKINDDEPDSLRCFQTGASNVTQIRYLVLPYRQNTISFEFIAVEYSDPANNSLQYRLFRHNGEPYDNNWVRCETARGFARYANLPPGEYVLHIRGANSDGVWNPEPRQLRIKITPPFWQTWWFRAIWLAVLAGAIYAGIQMYLRNQLREKNYQLREQRLQIEKQEALTQERNRIAGEMHDDLGGGLTSIRMLSSRVQKKIDNPEIQTQVDKIAHYSQELVQKMGEIIWAMNSNFDTVENLVAYIRRYAVDFLDVSGLRYHIREPEEMPDFAVSGERRRNVYLAVKESLHNVVKHAHAERVSISFEVKDEQLVVHIQDDGKGIDLDQVNQFGNGLYNMRKRLRDIGGDMLMENTDGTLLTFIVPLEKSAQS